MRLLVVRYLAFVVVRPETMARGNAGALCSTVAASSALTGEKDSACSVSVAGSVLVEYARADRQSMVMKLRRELSPPVFVAVAL